MLKTVLVSLVALVSLSATQQSRIFTGTISDDMCAFGGHAAMRMGPTDAECTRLCVMAHGSSYVLADGKNVYLLSDQTSSEQFAGQKVRIAGRLDVKTKTIQVMSIRATK